MALLRSRVPTRSSESTDSSALLVVMQVSSKENANKRTGKWIRRCGIRTLVFLSVVFYYIRNIVSGGQNSITSSNNKTPTSSVVKAPMGGIVYGAKSKGDDTARYVMEAIQTGFRHIATVSLSLGSVDAFIEKHIHTTMTNHWCPDLFLGWIPL